ncbi:hypothetical protein Q8F55_003445 [Vanrija albida]|uniref:Uncharacterized protein n=1 Tax=Vanrija albida TaxID=181172 RepID=A0ABR3Q4T0_9TREE
MVPRPRKSTCSAHSYPLAHSTGPTPPYPPHHRGLHPRTTANTSPLASQMSTAAAAADVPALAPPPLERRKSAPVDPSKLNNAPAPLPPQHVAPASPPPPEPLNVPGNADSAYLSTGDAPVEPPSHPTVAETGTFATSFGHGDGPVQGQLQRRESDVKRRIIRLASFGGEGLKIKPPVPLPGDAYAGEVDGVASESAIVETSVSAGAPSSFDNYRL